MKGKNNKKRNNNSSDLKKNNASNIKNKNLDTKKDNIKKTKEEQLNEIKEQINNLDKKKDNHKEQEIRYKKKIFRKTDNLLNFMSIVVTITSILYFFISLIKINELSSIINSIFIFIISILVLFLCYSSKKRNTFSYFTLLTLFLFNLFNILNLNNIITLPNNTLKDFVGSNMSDVIKFSNKYNIKLIQEYEYSDFIDEYHIINQNIKPGTKLKDIKELIVVISEGNNPFKEILIPNMIGFNSDDVIKFIKDNNLTNVDIEYVKSNENYDTLINQSINGNMKRNDNIKFTFSLGNENVAREIKLKDLTNLSKFDLELYLKKNNIKCEYIYEFNEKIKRNYVIKQSIKAGKILNTETDVLKLTLSKGNKILVPDLLNYSIDEVTKWIIDNNLKVEFKDRYDDKIKKNNIVEVNYKKDDIVEEGTLIIVTLSKGNLVMEKFNNFNEFREWCQKYDIKYEEKHEFSNTVSIGNIIKYSYSEGETIKNGDIIIVTISDGKKIIVPNLYGLSKSEAINRINNNSLKYSFVYKYSDKKKGTVIGQSIRANSSVSSGTTITVTISNGARPAPPPQPKPPVCVQKTYTVTRALNNIFNNVGDFNTVKNNLINHFATNYPGVNLVVKGEPETGKTPGSYVSGIGPGSEIKSCHTYEIRIAQ